MFRDRKAFRDVIDLMLQSELHRDFYIKDLERLVFPAMKNGRMVLFYNDIGVPEGLYSHTFLTEEAQEGYLDGTRKLQPGDWATPAGKGTLWVIDFIAPFGNAAKLARRVQEDLTEKYIDIYNRDGAWWRRPAKGGHRRWTCGVLDKLEGRRKRNGHLESV